MIHKYPYTDFHELNLDYLIDLCMKTMGLHLELEGDFLCLINQAGEKVSKLKIHYADTALNDVDGKSIKAYVFDGGIDNRNLVLTRGNGETVVITIPYAVTAEKDLNNVDLTSYVHGVGVSGNKILVTFGNGTTYSFTCPFATKASEDENGKKITSYVAEITTGNDKLIIKDGNGDVIAEITVPYATKALQDVDGDAIKETYATDLTTGTTTVILRDKVGNVLSTITVPYATVALQDMSGNAFLSDYGYNLGTNGNKITLESHTGATLNEITVPYATKAQDADNAIESVSISGDQIVFTTFGGQTTSITSPYAVKALKDSLNNTFVTSYIANAVNDPITGKITFYAQDGSVIAEMTPTVDRATHDSLGNTIADYVKTIVTDPNSNYVTVTHGDGNSDALTINYSTTAWKDTYGNVIGNVYIRSLAIVEDAIDGHEYLVAYNGELSELFRIDLNDLSVVTSMEDLDDVAITTPTDGDILVYDGNDDEWKNAPMPVIPDELDDLSDVEITSPTDGDIVMYDGNTNEWENRQLTVHSITDVNVPNVPDEGDILIFDSNSGKWFNAPLIMNNLIDVDAPAPSDGDILVYDSVNQNWTNATPTAPSNIGDLNDVDIQNPVVGDILIYDQQDGIWYNKDLLVQNIANVDINTVTDGEILVYDSNTMKWKNTSLPDLIDDKVRDEQINVNTTIQAGSTTAVTLQLSGNFTHRPVIFTPMLSSSFTSDISIEYVRLSLFNASSITINVQLRNHSSNAQTVQGIIYLSLFTR